ncbi:MAG: 16S rRNA (adenine(1518)-N(6)/adenine(1519)-N(6))-dimethyltransferase RsmA [Dehalococcoidales bacterium]|nr:16S rRNA (adenine(1518)-N(6)/adenine(1519)-N(6))-dimethyltransferase RsmA [Dehalococcoidales bacterium]
MPPDLSIQPRPRAKSLLTQTRQLLRQAGLRARKGLGQHFLVDGGVLKYILSAAELSPADIVIEVGPGLGVLTRELARQAGWVVAVELDDNLASLLKETLASFSNVTIVNQDILKVDPQALLREHFPDRKGGSWHYKVVANLPYYITSPVLRHFLEASLKPQTMVVMVQKEVARQITAQPGRLSLLGISVQLYGEPKIVEYVRASSFYPAPEVDSAILRITVYPRPVVEVDTESFFTVVRAGFSAARKQLGNPLAHGLGWPKAEVLALLEKAGIDSRRRAETLSIKEWARLWRVCAQAKEIT